RGKWDWRFVLWLRVEVEDFRGSFAHFYLADLAGDGHRELVGDVHVAGDLVVGELAGAELTQGLRRDGGGAGAEPDPGHQLLAVPGVRDADHLRVQDVG